MSKAWKLIKNRLDRELGEEAPHGAIGKFCEKSGIKRRTLSTWLKEGQVPSIDFIDQIAKGLGFEDHPWDLIRPEPADKPLWRAAEAHGHTLADCKRAVDAALEEKMAADAKARAKADHTGPGARDVREDLDEE